MFFFRIQSSGTHFENCNLFSFSSWSDLFSLPSFQFFKSPLIIEIMHSNIPVTSLVLLFSVLLTVNTSPVPDHSGLALLGLVARQDGSLLERDMDLECRQGSGPGGAGGTGGGGAGVSLSNTISGVYGINLVQAGAGGAKAAAGGGAGAVSFQVHLDVGGMI
jgi:hypothetical protein